MSDMMNDLLGELRNLNQNLSQKQETGMVDGLRSGLATVRTAAHEVTGIANDAGATAKALNDARFQLKMLFDPQGSAAIQQKRKLAEAQLNLHNAQTAMQVQMLTAQANLQAVPLQQAATASDADLYAQMMTAGFGGTQVVAAAPQKGILDHPATKVVAGVAIVGVGIGVGVYVGRALAGAGKDDSAAFDDSNSNVIDINAAGNY